MNIADFIATKKLLSFEEFTKKFPDVHVLDSYAKPERESFRCAYVYEDHYWIACYEQFGQLVFHCPIESSTHVSKSLSKLEKVLFNWANDDES
jgi:hypothetical protein